MARVRARSMRARALPPPISSRADEGREGRFEGPTGGLAAQKLCLAKLGLVGASELKPGLRVVRVELDGLLRSPQGRLDVSLVQGQLGPCAVYTGVIRRPLLGGVEQAPSALDVAAHECDPRQTRAEVDAARVGPVGFFVVEEGVLAPLLEQQIRQLLVYVRIAGIDLECTAIGEDGVVQLARLDPRPGCFHPRGEALFGRWAGHQQPYAQGEDRERTEASAFSHGG